MFVLIGQQLEQIVSITNLRPLNATINLGNNDPDLRGFGGWGSKIGAGFSGTRTGSNFRVVPTSAILIFIN
jgi:hypothetical protein